MTYKFNSNNLQKGNEIKYSDRSNEVNEADMVKEEVAYGLKQQGEYTLEDYYAIREDRLVELIDGFIYEKETPSVLHQMILGEMLYSLCDFKSQHKEYFIFVVHCVSVQLDCDDITMMEPDVLIVRDRSKIKKFVYGAPDFIVEIYLPSTVEMDSSLKLRKYKEAGVKEYWMVDPDKKKVIVYDWTKSEIPMVYGFDSKVSVGVLGGECEIDFAEIYEEIKFLYEKE